MIHGFAPAAGVCRAMTACGTSYALNDAQCRSMSARNSPRVSPYTSFGTAVVVALIDEPEGPKLMVEAIAKTWMSEIHGDALHQRVVVGEIGIATTTRAALVCRRLVAGGPDSNVGGTVFRLAPASKIHINAGTANHEISREHPPRRLQFDAMTCFSGGFD